MNKPQILGSLEESINSWLERASDSGDLEESFPQMYWSPQSIHQMAEAAFNVLCAMNDAIEYANEEGVFK